MKIHALNGRAVGQVYSGVAGKCCCGCAGRHSYSKLYREAGGLRRGYAVDEDEVSDRSVSIVLGKISRAMAAGPSQNVSLEKTYAAYETETRQYVAYYV